MPKQGVGFDREEVNCLLNAVKRVLPIGGYEWDTVFVEHERAYPNRDRTREGIKCKFNSLHHVQIPTGDPNIPPEALRAKFYEVWICLSQKSTVNHHLAPTVIVYFP